MSLEPSTPARESLPERPTEPERPLDELLRPLTATFRDASLEAEFQREYLSQRLRPFARRALALGVITYASYGLHDLLVLPEPRGAWLVRYALVLPALTLCWALTYWRGFARAHQAVLLGYGMSATLGVLAIAARSPLGPHALYAGFAALFVTIGPLIARLQVRTEALYTLLSTLALAALEAQSPEVPTSVRLGLLWTLVAMGSLGTLLSWLNERQEREAFLARRTIRAQKELIERERARSDALLRNVLPDAIAARLKDGEAVIADGYDEATVLFADIVGFTPLSARLSPHALVARLDEVFSAFDERCAALGLEKIKTIGDAYMVVGGVPTARPDHARAVVQMALEMQAVLAEQRATHGDGLDVRVGVHTGPVVAGVIGRRKFAYDVWGDTVNTASRMESHSTPGRVQISERTAQLVEGAFELEPRGEISVKGKGPMRTFFVLRARS